MGRMAGVVRQTLTLILPGIDQTARRFEELTPRFEQIQPGRVDVSRPTVWRLQRSRFDAVQRRGDPFTMANRAAAWTCQAVPITKDEATVLTNRGIENEASSLITRQGFHHMSQVILYLSLWNPQPLGELVGREASVGNQLNDTLTRGSLGRQHGPHPRQSRAESQPRTKKG